MKKFGLIGYPLEHSFSKQYFTEFFQKNNIKDCAYELYPLKDITAFAQLLKNHPDIAGLNVTIPYKQSIIPHLDGLNKIAADIGAVNTILVANHKTRGYNTDVYGFYHSLKPLLAKHHTKALILGSGGAARAVIYVLKRLKIDYLVLSRSPQANQIGYHTINKSLMNEYTIIINTTPLGMSPHKRWNDSDKNRKSKIKMPPIPYQYLTSQHLLYDLIYNPPLTEFLKQGQKYNTQIKNGLEMLHLQAQQAWEIWSN